MEIFPFTSITVQVTVVTPIGNVAGALLVTEEIPQLSAVVGVPKTTPEAVHADGSVFTLTLAGQVMVGFSPSVIDTVCVQVAEFPFTSVTVQVTTVTPILNTAGASLVTVATPQLSAV